MLIKYSPVHTAPTKTNGQAALTRSSIAIALGWAHAELSPSVQVWKARKSTCELGRHG